MLSFHQLINDKFLNELIARVAVKRFMLKYRNSIKPLELTLSFPPSFV